MRPFGQGTKQSRRPRTIGEVRKSQLITTHGPGSIVDFVGDTAMIAGTDHWGWCLKDLQNPHLVHHENLQNLLGVDYFVEPKIDTTRRPFYANKSEDVPAYRFPRMMYCTSCKRLLDWSIFENRTSQKIRCLCGKDTILASRFVVVCQKGHIDDFPYFTWVHRGEDCSAGRPPGNLSMFNVEGRSSIESLIIKCNDCGMVRSMVSAFAPGALNNIMECRGNSPWLPRNTEHDCGEELVTRLRSSSSIYFPAVVSGISIPPWSAKVFNLLETYYDFLLNAKDPKSVIRQYILPRLSGYSEQDALDGFQQLRQSKLLRGRRTWPDIYYDEYLALSRSPVQDEEYSSQFIDPPRGYEDVIEKVVAIDSLTEVVAFLGFTRLTPWTGRKDDERLAPISLRKKNWLPAVKLRGEGIFIQFKLDLVEDWAKTNAQHYGKMLSNLNRTWLENERASVSYVFLHTFAHLLIRRLATESGYGIASLKERIYSSIQTKPGDPEMKMAGVLIYTASPDADGSLGGLVEQSLPERLGPLITAMLSEAEWCSSDPLCLDSYGSQGQGFASLNYAACHACALLPETACEFHNVLLDRAALVGQPNNKELGFFSQRRTVS